MFSAITEFVEDFKSKLPEPMRASIYLDKLLLDDFCHNKSFGDSFMQSHQIFSEHWSPELKKGSTQENLSSKVKEITAYINRHYNETLKDQIHFDEQLGKFTLLYAQIHHIATRFPKKPIHFHFYDDRADILRKLIAVFSYDKRLIPENMTLHFHYYEKGSQVMHKTTQEPIVKCIQGTGTIDETYQQTVKELMATLPAESMPFHNLENVVLARSGDPLDALFQIDILRSAHPNVLPKPAYQKWLTARNARLYKHQKEEKDWVVLDEVPSPEATAEQPLQSSFASRMATVSSAVTSATSTLTSFGSSLFESLKNVSPSSKHEQRNTDRRIPCPNHTPGQ